MNKMMIAAIAVAAVLLAAGAYVVMSMGNSPPDDGTDDGDDTNPQSDAVDSQRKTLEVSFPTEIRADDRKMGLSMTYPGMGESGYTYNWSEYYQFGLTASPASGYKGNVLIKMFAEKSGEIGEESLIAKDFKGNVVDWTFAKKNNSEPLQNMISGDIASWKTNGSVSLRSFDVMYKTTGNFTLIIQAFDLDTGKAISDQVIARPLYVPVTGELAIKALNRGAWETTANGTYYVILVNITNNWNVRYDVKAANLVLIDGSETVSANTTAMVFKAQSLAPLQSTQFQAYFNSDHGEDRDSLVLQYRDDISGETIDVPLPLAVT